MKTLEIIIKIQINQEIQFLLRYIYLKSKIH